MRRDCSKPRLRVGHRPRPQQPARASERASKQAKQPGSERGGRRGGRGSGHAARAPRGAAQVRLRGCAPRVPWGCVGVRPFCSVKTANRFVYVRAVAFSSCASHAEKKTAAPPPGACAKVRLERAGIRSLHSLWPEPHAMRRPRGAPPRRPASHPAGNARASGEGGDILGNGTGRRGGRAARGGPCVHAPQLAMRSF
jgi:hypothetical protein